MFNLNSLGLCACLLMPFSTVIAYDDSQLGPILATAKAVATVKQVMQSHKGELDNDEEMLDKGSQLTRTLFCEAATISRPPGFRTSGASSRLTMAPAAWHCAI